MANLTDTQLLAAITKASNSALRGSLVLPVPFAKNFGAILSMAKACKMRGAPIILSSTDHSVAPHIQAITNSGTREILNRMSLSFANALESTVKAKKNANAI